MSGSEPQSATAWQAQPRWLLQSLDVIGGTSAITEPKAKRVARTTAASLALGSVAAGALGLLYIGLGATLDAIVGLTCAVGAAAILALWRLTGRTAVATHGTLSFFVVVFCAAAWLTGSAAYLSWVAVVVLVGYYSGGLRLGALWTAIALGAVLVTATGVGPPHEFGLESPGTTTGLVSCMRSISLVPVIALLGAAYEVTRLDYVHEVEIARQHAERANAARARLMTKVSHEIRTPLNGILGLTEATLHAELPPEVRGDVEAVRASGKVLLSLVNDLLDVARAEAGRLAVAVEPVELRTVVDEVAALYRATAVQKGLALEVSIEGPGPTRLCGDEVRLRQVLGNLVSNAIKFTRAGRVRVRLESHPSSRTPGRFDVRLAVQDTGLGMTEADRAQLFTPFFQARAEDQHQGTGLGLAICQELVQRMGGTLTVESTLGVGSAFYVALTLDAPPRARVPSRAGGTASAKPSVTPEPARSALVIDDNAVNLRVASALLGRLGVTVTAVGSGAAAIAEARIRSFDVVLTDLHMPELDGFETARALRDEGFVGPIFALTASAEHTTADACRDAGLDGCLTKPVSLAALRALVDGLRGPERSSHEPQARPEVDVASQAAATSA